MKLLDFEKHLKKNKCKFLRQGGNHTVWINEANSKQSAVPRHKELSNMLCITICKQLEITTPKSF